jgi:hypothetical protein
MAITSIEGAIEKLKTGRDQVARAFDGPVSELPAARQRCADALELIETFAGRWPGDRRWHEYRQQFAMLLSDADNAIKTGD